MKTESRRGNKPEPTHRRRWKSSSAAALIPGYWTNEGLDSRRGRGWRDGSGCGRLGLGFRRRPRFGFLLGFLGGENGV